MHVRCVWQRVTRIMHDNADAKGFAPSKDLRSPRPEREKCMTMQIMRVTMRVDMHNNK
ncbi:hypothetical protein HYC85_029178 [Camellia sinensis]|uniref:Uncharacterized protein n=1 Tax=Camellia sinensis TaxID=4442 RepID=A0A7J7FXY2_CAMSI|nr:hypothetical protein HYC85_029178 [Camellia sinensis]